MAMPAGSAWVRADFDNPQQLAPEFWALDPEAVRPCGRRRSCHLCASPARRRTTLRPSLSMP